MIHKNKGILALIDVIYCGYCGSKLTNEANIIIGQLKSTGEKKTSKTPVYKCQGAWQGIPHSEVGQFRANEIEPIVFEAIAAYIGKLQENENVFDETKKSE